MDFKLGMKSSNWRKMIFVFWALWFLVVTMSKVAKADENKPTLKEIWSKDFEAPIQNVSLGLDKDGNLESASVQTFDENKDTSIHYLDAKGKTVNEKKSQKGKAHFFCQTEKGLSTRRNGPIQKSKKNFQMEKRRVAWWLRAREIFGSKIPKVTRLEIMR